MKLAILLHMFDLTLLPEFYDYISNIGKAGYKYDVYIAISDKYDLAAFKTYWPKAVVIHHEDRGMDVGGFFALCPSLFRSKYDYVLKLHTKRNAKWRKALIEPLLGTPERVRRGITAFAPGVGMVGSKSWLITMGKDWGIYNHHINSITEVWGVPKTTCKFIGGTIFWIRYSILREAMNKVNIPTCLLYTSDAADE